MRLANMFVPLLACGLASGCCGNALNGGGPADAGTGPDGGALRDYVSGTRLRAQVYASVDGSRAFHGWFDGQLQQACRFNLADDGEIRCLPPQTTPTVGGPIAVFTDAACTQLAFVQALDLPAPKQVSLRSRTTCSSTAYAVGAMQTVQNWYTNPFGAAGACTAWSNPRPVALYLAGAVLPASMFVRGALVREPRGGELSMQVWVGEDGSLESIEPYDSTRQESCGVPPSPSSTADVCAPLVTASQDATRFTDPNCTSQAAAFPTLSCFLAETPKYALEATPIDSCHDAWSGVRLLGTSATQLYSGVAGNCNATTGGVGYSYASFGASEPFSNLPRLKRTVLGAGVIVEQWLTSNTDEALRLASFFDNGLMLACYPVLTSDGTTRCVPSSAQAVPDFVDAKCTQPIVYTTPTVAGCAADPPPAMFSAYGLGVATNQARVFQTGARATAPTAIYAPRGGICTAGVLPTDPQTAWWAVSEIPPAQFGQLKDLTE